MTKNPQSSRGLGIMLSAKLGLDLTNRNGHDLAGHCIACKSSDAFGLHMDTGVGHCYSCQGGWSPYDIAKIVLKDEKAARLLMVELGVFEPPADSNGHAGQNGSAIASDAIGQIARMKSMPRESLVAYGATIHSPTEIRIPVYDRNGARISYFRLFTHPDAKGKLPKGGKAGLFLPHVEDQVRLPKQGETWHVVEGCKDAATLHNLGLLAVGLCTSGMNAKFARLFAGVNVIVVPDRDAAGERGASKTGSVLFGVATTVRIATLPAEFRPSKGEDVRDVLKREGGRELVLKALEDARPWDSSASKQDTLDDRPSIEVTPDEHEVNDAAVNALAKDATIFQRGGAIVEIQHDHSTRTLKGISRPANAPRIVVVRDPSLRERLTAVARFVKRKETEEGDDFIHVHPPAFCISAVAARGHWPGVRHLEGVINSPILRRDGTVLDTPGYDPATGLFYDPEGLIIEVPESPSHDDARAACEVLLEVVADFPFAKPAHSAAWLALVLTPLARHAFAGPSPLFLIDANIRASGKSMLADAAALIVTGRTIARTSCPGDDDEMRKRITAITLGGDQMLLLDNISGELGGAALDAALTGTVWKDRILGRSEIVEMPLVTTWAATGNNVVLAADTSRRVCHIRLESKLENPEERDEFRHPQLLEWVRLNRPRLLSAALTVLSAFCRAGRPDQRLKPWGSYDDWSGLVRQALVWAGQPDPGETRQELARSADREAMALRALIQGWHEIDSDGMGLTATKLIALLEKLPDRYEVVRNAVLELCPAPAGKLPNTRSLGTKLGHLRGRVVGGKAIDRRDQHGTSVWLVLDMDQSTDAGGCSGGSGCSISDDLPAPFPATPPLGAGSGAQKWPETDPPHQLEQPGTPIEDYASVADWRGDAWEEEES